MDRKSSTDGAEDLPDPRKDCITGRGWCSPGVAEGHAETQSHQGGAIDCCGKGLDWKGRRGEGGRCWTEPPAGPAPNVQSAERRAGNTIAGTAAPGSECGQVIEDQGRR